MELERKELETMAAANNGVVTVDMVIDAAKNEDSPLHSHFEWDNDKAAENYRRWHSAWCGLLRCFDIQHPLFQLFWLYPL